MTTSVSIGFVELAGSIHIFLGFKDISEMMCSFINLHEKDLTESLNWCQGKMIGRCQKGVKIVSGR